MRGLWEQHAIESEAAALGVANFCIEFRRFRSPIIEVTMWIIKIAGPQWNSQWNRKNNKWLWNIRDHK